MPAKKTRRQAEQPPWQIILEEIRSQNRATIEAVEASRLALEQRIDRLERETSQRDTALEMAIRELRLDVRQLQGEMKVLQGEVKQLQGEVKQLQGEVRSLDRKVETLAHLEERVSALERRLAS